jgi:hypothetical protein
LTTAPQWCLEENEIRVKKLEFFILKTKKNKMNVKNKTSNQANKVKYFILQPKTGQKNKEIGGEILF